MNSELLRSILAERAEDVADSGPDLVALHARVAAERRRRRTRVGVTAVASAVAVVLAVVVLGGADPTAPRPAPEPAGPSPTPTSSATPGRPLPVRSDEVEVLAKPYDRDAVARPRVLTTLRSEPGDPTLEWVVDRTAAATHVQESCQGPEGTWLVVVGALGSSSAAPCGRSGGFRDQPMPTMPFGTDTGWVLPGVGEPLEAFVTTVEPMNANGPRGMRKGIPTETTASFELVVWGHDPAPVASMLGREVLALGVAAGRDWWFTRGVEAATGARSLTLQLPASPVERLVQTVTDYSRVDVSQVEEQGGLPAVELVVDGVRTDNRFERPTVVFQDEPSAVVPAGGPHTVVLRVAAGSAAQVDFGAAVFEAGDRR